MRVLLASPVRSSRGGQVYATFPNGLLYIAAVLERNGHDVQVFDGNVDNRKPADFLDFSPQLIGFTVASGPMINDAIALSKEFKELMPQTRIIWGGTHPSTLPEQTLDEEYIDYVAVGPGEYTMLELARHLETRTGFPDEVRGLVFKRDGNIVRNEPRSFIADLDELPDPAWHLVNVNSYWEISLNTSRGCPFSCTYCYNPAFHHGYRADFSVERIIKQIKHLQHNYGVKHFKFFEDNFTFNRKRLREFCDEVIKQKLKFEWDCEARADLNEDEIKLMARAGCVSVGLGVETGSTRLLKFLKKGMNLKQMEKAFWFFVKHNITPRLYIMHGLPTETIEDFVETHRMLARLDHPPYIYMHFVPYPGSALSEYCNESGLIQVPQCLADWSDFLSRAGEGMNLSNMSDEVLKELQDNFGRTFATRRLRFAIRHRPLSLLKSMARPNVFFKSLRDLVRCSLSHAVKDKADQRYAPIDILKSPVLVWFQHYQKAVDLQVMKQTIKLTRQVEMLEWQMAQTGAANSPAMFYEDSRVKPIRKSVEADYALAVR